MAPQCLGRQLSTLDVTGSAVTNADHMLTGWPVAELRVEGSNAGHLRRSDVGDLAHAAQCLFGQVAVLLLYGLKDRDKCLGGMPHCRDHFVHPRQINR